jgi:hypothetical protein
VREEEAKRFKIWAKKNFHKNLALKNITRGSFAKDFLPREKEFIFIPTVVYLINLRL